MRRVTLITVLSIVASFAASAVLADSVAARMDVSVRVPANCRLTVPPLSFGAYDPMVVNAATPADASAVVVVNCTRNTAATLSFDLGLHAASGDGRFMGGPGTEQLRYEIYQDAARSQTWRTGADSMRLTSGGLGAPDQVTVFGRIPPRQEVEAGAYNDVLTAAVDF